MARRTMIICMTLLLCATAVTGVHAQEPPAVLLVPFEVFSGEDLGYLRNQIPEMIHRQLKDKGGRVELMTDTDFSGLKHTDVAGYRRLGLQRGADYVLWGSITWIGTSYSIDAKLLRSFEKTPPETYFIEGSGVETLLGTVEELVNRLSLKLFEWEKVVEVRVLGNKRIETEAIKRHIKTVPDDIFVARLLSEDLKSIYSMGYFEDIRIEAETSPRGKIITFKVKEKPTIRFIRIKGNYVFDDEELRNSMDISTGAILNIYQVQNSLKRIETLYKEKNYHNVRVSYTVEKLKNNQADLLFTVEEGDKVRIREIRFMGNRTYSDKTLKKLMSTDEKGFFSWITSSGELKREKLDQDVASIEAFYHNNGFINAKVGEPVVTIDDEWIYITIKIDEGVQYGVGNVSLTGDLIADEKELYEKLKITKEDYYNREVVRKDVLGLTDLYSDNGYAYAEIRPKIQTDEENRKVDITYDIDKGPLVYFERIIIAGNTKTRDKVIRRELGVEEQGLFSGSEIKKGIRKLHRLDYFEDVKVDTFKGSAEDQMVLRLDVTEKPTGAFSFGGGYSSLENVFFMGSVTQRNLFGRGQTLSLKAELGSRTTRYSLSFVEPWLFDIPLSLGIDTYKWLRDYDEYDRDSIGMGVNLGYPVYEYTRAYVSYEFDISDVTNISDTASVSIKDMEGENTTSKIGLALQYDSRDRLFNPNEGAKHRLAAYYAGLGGDVGFTKYTAESGVYFPLVWKLVGFTHGSIGYVQEVSGKKLPDYEKFYLGGINTLRGFNWRDVSVTDDNGDVVGGQKMLQFNFEIIFPIFEKAGLRGVVFYDTGNVYRIDENFDIGNMRKSAGFGFRWYSPIGPIRIENGYILDPKPGEDSGGRWEFTMGGAF